MTRVCAHRGTMAGRLENTVEGAEVAWSRGCDGVEIDVRVTSDGVAVAFHDHDTARFGGAGTSIRQLRFSDLGNLNTSVPRLEEVAEVVPPDGTLWLDIKSQVSEFGAIATAISRCRLRTTQLAFQSFDPAILKCVAESFPACELYWLMLPLPTGPNCALRYGTTMLEWTGNIPITGYALHFESLTDDFSNAVRSKNLGIYLWTVNELSHLTAARDFAPAWIETDRLAYAWSVLQKPQRRPAAS